MLVAQAFLGPCPEGKEINHKNGIKTRNEHTNLEYVTHKQNMQHAHDNGLCCPARGEQNGSVKLKDNEVWLIKKLLAHNIKQYIVAKMFKVTPTSIYFIRMGKSWSHIRYLRRRQCKT